MRKTSKRHQRGVTLIALLAILVLGSSWWLLSRGGAAPANRTAQERVHNAQVLLQVKAALVGYVASRAAETTENNPGRLPCPEAAGNVGGVNEGVASGNCTLPAIGRLPWRTLGLEKLRDAAGEPLWYVVSPGWALSNSTNPPLTTYINSDSAGQLTLDGAGSVVALIIAPGRPLAVPASANCSARNQARTTPSPTIDFRDYLECQNANSPADTAFTATGPSEAFNDQVLAVTAADVLPGIEAAVAKRIESQIVPVLRTAYTGAKWGPGMATLVFPFAAPFADPGSATFQGAAATYAGLLPFSYSPPCAPAGDVRCTPANWHAWGTPSISKTSGAGSLWGTPSCSLSGSTITCTGYYINGSLQASFDDRVSNVAAALRDFTLADHTATVWTILHSTSGGGSWGSWQIESSSLGRRLNSDASLSFVVDTPLRWGGGNTDYGYYYIEAARPAITDHSLLSEATGSPTGWFARNQWYRLLYYAIAPTYAAGGTGSCSDTAVPPTCLQVANIAPANKQRAILVLAGRSVTGAVRPNGNIADFLDSAENQNAGTVADLLGVKYEQLKISKSFNDRILVLDSNP